MSVSFCREGLHLLLGFESPLSRAVVSKSSVPSANSRLSEDLSDASFSGRSGGYSDDQELTSEELLVLFSFVSRIPRRLTVEF